MGGICLQKLNEGFHLNNNVCELVIQENSHSTIFIKGFTSNFHVTLPFGKENENLQEMTFNYLATTLSQREGK